MAGTVYVNKSAKPGGNGTKAKPWGTLGEGVADLEPGDILKLSAHRYETNGITITDKNITIQGAGQNQTTIDGGDLYTIRMGAPGLTIKDLGVTGSGHTGIQGIGFDDLEISRVKVFKTEGPGVYFAHADWLKVTDSAFTYNGATWDVPGQLEGSVGLSMHNLKSATPGWDGTIHVLVEGNTFAYNGASVPTFEGHGVIVDLLTKGGGDGTRVANLYNYKQQIMLRYNDIYGSDNSGVIVHHAEQRGAVNPNFITIQENNIWDNNHLNRAGGADIMINYSDGVRLLGNLIDSDAGLGAGHASVRTTGSQVFLKANVGTDDFVFIDSAITSGGGNYGNTPIAPAAWLDNGRAEWLDDAKADTFDLASAKVGIDHGDAFGVQAPALHFDPLDWG